MSVIDKLKEKWQRTYADDAPNFPLEEYIDEILSDLEQLRPYVELAEMLLLFTNGNIGRYNNPMWELEGMNYFSLSDMHEHVLCVRIKEINDNEKGTE